MNTLHTTSNVNLASALDMKKHQSSSIHGDDSTASHLLLDPYVQVFRRFPFDETISATFYGYRRHSTRFFLYNIACVLTCGIVYLLGRWIPKFLVWATMQACSLAEAEYVLVINSFNQRELVELQRTSLPDGVTMLNLLLARDPEAPLTPPSNASTKAASTTAIHELCVLDYKCNRFILDPSTGHFIATSDYPNAVPITSMDAAIKGLPLPLLQRQRLIFGPNVIDIARRTIPQLLLDVVLHPFNVFQVAGVIIWSIQEYKLYATVILLLTALSAITTLIEQRLTTEKMRKMARFTCPVSVLRAGKWLRLSSAELCPGDLVMLSGDDELEMIPFDGILLNGDALIDECLLTGESIPVIREAVSDEAPLFNILNDSSIETTSQLGLKSVIFAGTRLVRARPRHNRPAMALVTRTGFLTAKGNLVQSILFPRPNNFRFYRDSMIFIAILGCIAAIGFCGSLASLIHLKPGWYYIISRTLDLITVVVPPALHTTMTIGTIFAIRRLKQDGIYCISPPRINVCSRINIMLFDKTGTLTEEGLDVMGILPSSPTSLIERQHHRFTEFFTDRRQVPQTSLNPEAPPLALLMASCHSLQRVHNELIGDPLDLKMFEFSGWEMEEQHTSYHHPIQHHGQDTVNEGTVYLRPPPSFLDSLQKSSRTNPADSSVAIVKCFEFVPQLRRMSVLCRVSMGADLAVLCKGSPESMLDICQAETIPPDYLSVLAEYAHQGYRVIACAGKYLRSLSLADAQRVPRESIESDLVFLGFLVFENKLRPQTAPVISELQHATIKTLMCTGDNILTAVCVAKGCGIVPRDALIFAPTLSTRSLTPHSNSSNDDKQRTFIEWECIDDKEITLDPNSLVPFNLFFSAPVILACTGDVLEWVLESNSTELLDRVLAKTRIFGRMSPCQKQILVELYQKSGNIVGFCGDGANDCGALRAADVGISLSQAEASVAAPFTSKMADIRCVVNVIREGRASLVTSFSAFKYMALYSMIQFTSLIFLYAYASTLGDWQFVYIDLMMVLPLGLLMTRFGTAKKLVPQPPGAKLISPTVLLSIIGQTVIQGIVQSVGYLLTNRLDGHESPKVIPDKPNIESAENTSIFFLSTFLYVTIAFVYCAGRPHRRGFYWPFYTWIAVMFVINVVVLFVEWDVFTEWLQLVQDAVPLKHRYRLLALALGHFVTSWFCEKLAFPAILRLFVRDSEDAPTTSINENKPSVEV